MSDESPDAGDQPGLLRRAYRTVSPAYRSRSDPEMDTVGWTIFLLLVVLLVPLLPFIAIVWLISKILDALTTRRGGNDGD